MTHALLTRAALLLTAALIPFNLHAEENWVGESNAITGQVLEVLAQFQPEGAAGLGVEGFDADIIDLDPGLYERWMEAHQALIPMLEEKRRTAEHPKLMQDIDILIQSLEDQITSQQLAREHLLPYYNMPENLFYGFRSLLDPRTDPERYPAILERLEAYNAGEGIAAKAKARTAERFEVAGLAGPYEGEVQRDLANLPRFIGGMRQLLTESGVEGWEADMDALAVQLEDYGAWVEAEILPRARKDHRLPAEIYADNLKNFGVRDEPEQLIRMAQFGFAEIRATMKSLARQIADKRGWDNGELMHVMAELKKEQLPPDQVLDIYKERLATIEDMIRDNDVVTLPDRPANIRLATEAESASIPAPFMSPPQLIGNTGQYGEFVLVQKNLSMDEGDAQMDDWTHESITWALTVHEARPGHEMQFASLVENGTSQARAIYAFNSANVEGWGLYSEAIMMEYLPLEGQLFTLLARLQRAGRMFMDPMVNLGLMTPEEAQTFMIEQIGLSPAMAKSEADRYAFLMPGQATAYYYGFMNLQRLRTEAEMKLGERFNQRRFHDFLLAQGLLPPDLLRAAVLEEFIPSQ